MYEVLLVVYLLVAIGLIGLVLIQQGKGADMGASFGAGASGSLFGSGGSANFLTRTTAVLATAFFGMSLLLGYLSTSMAKQEADWQDLSSPAAIEQPVENTSDVPAVPATTSGDSDVPTN